MDEKDTIVSTIFKIQMPIQVLWSPQPDITAYELALALNYIHTPIFRVTWDAMPEGIKRHFKEMG